MTSQAEFQGKLYVLTGATVGIGKEIAYQLNRENARLVLIGSNLERLEKLKEEINNPNHEFIQFDLKNVIGISELVQRIVEKCGPISGFINCVGVRSRRPINLLTTDHVQEVFQTNYFSFIEFVKNIVKKKNYSEGLSIVQISSIAAERGAPSVTAYSASKAAVDASIRCLARELAPKGIRLNSLVPAQINTPVFQELIASSDGKPDPTLQRQFLGLGEPSDVSNFVLFLLSEKSRFISGHSLPIDGGFLVT